MKSRMTLTKIELDIYKHNEIKEACEFAFKYRCPVIVVPPELVSQARLHRGVAQGKFKIVSSIDAPKGINYAHNKLRGVPVEAMSADGFEIMLTGGDKKAIVNEIKFLSTLSRDYFPPGTEVRFTLGVDKRDSEQVKNMLEAFKAVPQPALLRTTPLTSVKVASGTHEYHNNIKKLISDIYRCKIKISGNINRNVIVNCDAHRYAMNIEQARSIIREAQDLEKLSQNIDNDAQIQDDSLGEFKGEQV